MRKAAVTLVMMLALVGFAGQSWAAPTDTITVTVSLAETVSVALDSNAWTIGVISLAGSYGPQSYLATNDGNVPIDLVIRATDGAGGWNLESAPGPDEFSVDVTSPPISLSSISDQTLATDIAVSGTADIELTYNAPISDSYGGGVGQGFTITLSATIHVP